MRTIKITIVNYNKKIRFTELTKVQPCRLNDHSFGNLFFSLSRTTSDGAAGVVVTVGASRTAKMNAYMSIN